MSEEEEKCRRGMCRIGGCFIWLRQAKDDEKVEKLIWK